MKICRTRFAIGQVVKIIRVIALNGPFCISDNFTLDDLIRKSRGTYGILRRVEFDASGTHFQVELVCPDKMVRVVTAVIRRAPAGQQPTSYASPSVSTATGNGLVPHPGP